MKNSVNMMMFLAILTLKQVKLLLESHITQDSHEQIKLP